MYATFDEPTKARVSLESANKQLLKLLELHSAVGKERLLLVSEDIFADPTAKNKLYRIIDGNILFDCDGRPVFVYEPGDVIGIHQAVGHSMGVYRCNFSVKCVEFDVAELLNAIRAVPENLTIWSEALALHGSAYLSLAMSFLPPEKEYRPSILAFQSGTAIIEQGSLGSDVYSLLEGSAKVIINGLTVGTIEKDNIFGVFAALTGKPRSASIVAQENCLAMKLDKDKFLDLIRNKPHAIEKLVREMVHVIEDLNEKVIASQNPESKRKSWT